MALHGRQVWSFLLAKQKKAGRYRQALSFKNQIERCAPGNINAQHEIVTLSIISNRTCIGYALLIQ
jgi:hypothetical protein